MRNDTILNAQKYSQANFKNTYYLGYRDIPSLISKYSVTGKAIDFGCGAGRSTLFINSLGFSTIGVDISKKMLKEAEKKDINGHYLLIKHPPFPFLSHSYDLFFSCFVFFTVSSKKKLIDIFREANRVLKKDGLFIFVTGSEHLYSQKWLSYNVDFEQNAELFSGKQTKIELSDLSIKFKNYFWTHQDYITICSKSNFEVIEVMSPLGIDSDNIPWKDERTISPYTIYILKKIAS